MPEMPPADEESKARSLSRWENEGGANEGGGRLHPKPRFRRAGLDRLRGIIAWVSLATALVAGWLGQPGWLAIPIGSIAFFGSMKAIPEKTGLIAAAGIVAYVLAAFLLMKAGGAAHQSF
jgi:hypothetical protein